MGGNWLNSGIISSISENPPYVINGDELAVDIEVSGIEPSVTNISGNSQSGYYLFFIDAPKVGTVSIGSYSMARGYQTWAGYWAFAEGYYTRAMGRYSHAEGTDTFTWYAAHAEG
jgi:hypothetical protein